MSKVSLTQRRAMGRSQPKRPKLDFTSSPTPKTSYSFPPNSQKDLENDLVDNMPPSVPAPENKKTGPGPTVLSDWDEDLPEEMLEKVCLIADLSQAMADVPKVIDINDFSVPKQGCKRTVSERDIPESGTNLIEELEKLKEENEKLRESVETKEGEVKILRSQLKQNQEAKEAESLNNVKVVEDLQNSYKEKLEAAEKECKSVKTELQFKDLELKSLTERCKQLESSSSKVVLVEPQTVFLDGKKPSFSASQGPTKSKAKENEAESLQGDDEKPFDFKYSAPADHDGRKLGSIVCPEFFKFVEEPSVIPFYKFRSEWEFHVSSFDFDKREKYKWSGLPKQTVFIKDTYNFVTELLLWESFNDPEAEALILKIMGISVEILRWQKDVLLFLEQLQDVKKCDDSNCSLLENEEEVKALTMKSLLDGEKINMEECGLEARRILAMIASLMVTSKHFLGLVLENAEFLTLLKDVAASVGNVRKPTRYVGVLAGVAFILMTCLRERDLKKDSLTILSKIAEELILATPKLDVLTLVLEVLVVGTAHASFVEGLCRKGAVDSCALYLDTKLRQAMFFNREACPLKILSIHLTGLFSVPANRQMKWEATRQVIKWLNAVWTSSAGKTVKWLPTTGPLPENEERCVDFTECFVYLLSSCLRDYFLDGSGRPNQLESREIIRNGCLLIHRMFKSDSRLLMEKSEKLRLATLLKSFVIREGWQCRSEKSVFWILNALENGPKNRGGSAKQGNFNDNFNGLIDALTIDDELTIF